MIEHGNAVSGDTLRGPDGWRRSRQQVKERMAETSAHLSTGYDDAHDVVAGG
jgi:hypothetical protein